jgi:glycosyltransferase involved in cell wall biosynthesis
VIQLIDHSDPLRFQHTVAGPIDFLQTLAPHLSKTAIPIDISSRVAPIRDLRAANTLAAHLKAAPMIVHAHGVRAAWIAAFAKYTQPFPFIFTAHNMLDASGIEKIGLSVIFAHADRIIAVSGPVMESLVACGAPQEKIVIIPNGVDIDYYSNAGKSDLSIDINMGAGEFVVGCIARLSPEKGVDVLLDAAKLKPDINFIVAGTGQLESQLKAKAPSNVRFLGHLEDVRSVLRASDIIAIPSRTEGQGIVALEAMASGIPVVASDVGGLRSMLSNEDNALLVPPGNAEALSAAISRLLADASFRETLANSAGLLVRDRYDSHDTVEKIEGVYLELAT